MTRANGVCLSATRWLPLVALIAVLQLDLVYAQEPAAPAADSSKNKPAELLAADLDAAIKTLEKNDVRTFLELYAPVDILRQLRKQDLLDQAAKMISNQPNTKQQLLSILQAVRKEKPTFDKSRGVATIQVDTQTHAIEANPDELHLPTLDEALPVGLGGDLKQVIDAANKLLDEPNMTAFVEKLFPASELTRLKAPGAMQDLLQQFGEPAAKPKGPPAQRANADVPQLLQAMRADFKRLKALKPEMTENEPVAVFTMESSNSNPARVIKFQKVAGHWRLFDNMPRVTEELTRQLKLKPSSSVMTIQLERIGGNWRFVELPNLKSEGR